MFAEALGDKAGIRRFASGRYPLDEALIDIALDLSGRPFTQWEVDIPEVLPLGNPPFDPQLARQHFVVRNGGDDDASRRACPWQKCPSHY